MGGHIMFKSFSYLLISQIISRLVPFIVNIHVARKLSPSDMGVSSVHYSLVLAVVLSVREGVRRATVRGLDAAAAASTSGSSSAATDWQAMAVSATSLPCGILVGVMVWVFTSSQSLSDQTSSYMTGLTLYIVAALVELAAEPAYCLAQRSAALRVRVGVDSLATLARCLITLHLLSIQALDVKAVFGLAQLGYGSVVLLGYILYLLSTLPALRRSNQGGSWFNLEVFHLSCSFTVQAFWKLLLAEGEKAVVLLVSLPDDQGVYGLVSNLGALFVRIVLAPFEESAFQVFSREQVAGTSVVVSKAQTRSQLHLFLLLVKLATLSGLVIAVFGISYSYFCIRFLYGTHWSNDTDAVIVLQFYCVYIVFLATNGITEAFVHSVSTSQQLHSQNKWLLCFSLANLVFGILFQSSLGSSGIVLAGCTNMVLRIVYSVSFIRNYFRDSEENFWNEVMPPTKVVIALGTSLCISTISGHVFKLFAAESFIVASLVHIFVGAALLGVVMFVIWRFDRTFCDQLSAMRRGQSLSVETSKDA